jgi:hypothetical protein
MSKPAPAHPYQIRTSEVLALRDEIADYLRTLDRDPPCGPDDMEDPDNPGSWAMMEVRLQVRVSDHGDPDYRAIVWTIWTGDPSYDLDHRGWWGSTVIPFNGDPDHEGEDFDPVALADDMIAEVLDSAAQGDDLDDDRPSDHEARTMATAALARLDLALLSAVEGGPDLLAG